METFDINGQQMTGEQLADSYKKLQTNHTQVTQKNSDLSKENEKAKPWLEFENHLNTNLSPEQRAQVAPLFDQIVNDLKEGKAPTVASMKKLDNEIENAETKKQKAELEELRQTVYDNEYDKLVNGFEKTATKEGIEFKRADFEKFAGDWLSDLGIADDGEFTDSQLKKAYEAYEAKLIKESKTKVPPLSTSGGAAGVTKTETTKVGGLKGAGQRVMEKLRL